MSARPDGAEGDRRREAERWQRVQSVFHAAADRPEEEHLAFLEAACAGDAALREEVLALLREDRRPGVLEAGVGELARGVLDDDRDLPAIDVRFGRYRVVRRVGEGGSGVVYLAVRDDVGGVAAIKVLRDAWLSPARRARFTAEQRTLAQLRHRSIAHLYDADTLPDGTPWFAMEYVEGDPVTDHCARREAPLDERLRLFREACEAVQHAHRHAIVHRDLKPSNVLVDEEGSVKLLDFGIAKPLDDVGSDDHTRTDVRPMTLAYAAPEQIRGGRVGVHTDVYALGVILYELLAGKHPFELAGRSPEDAARVVLDQEPVRPSLASRRASAGGGWRGARAPAWADLDVLCLTAMHKDPARRYPTVEALLRDLDHYLAGEPLEARADRLGYRVRKFVTRNARTVTAAALAALLLLGVTAFHAVRLATARNAAVAEAARTERIQSFMLTLFEGGEEGVAPPDTLRVLALVDRGVREARRLDHEPAIQADLYETLGGIDQKLGNLARADTLLSAALERRTALFGPDHPAVARSAMALGLLRLEQARLEDAEALARRAVEALRRARPPDEAAIAEATLALGRVLVERGAYDDAIGALDESVRLRSASGEETPELAEALFELASVHFYAGNYPASDSLTRRVLWMHRRLDGPRHPRVADDLVNLGAIQHQLGRYPEAEGYYRQALDITRDWYGDDHHRTAAHLTMLGRTLVFQDRYDDAEALLRRALAIRERVFGASHPVVASTLNELGGVAYMRDELSTAEAHYRRIVEIYRSVHGERHYLVGIALSNLASVHQDRAEYGPAEELYREALAIYAATLPSDHLDAAIGRIKLGRTLLRQGRHAEAERETRAGFDVLSRQASPSVSWLRAARQDLVQEYEALGRPGDAARFRVHEAPSVADSTG